MVTAPAKGNPYPMTKRHGVSRSSSFATDRVHYEKLSHLQNVLLGWMRLLLRFLYSLTSSSANLSSLSYSCARVNLINFLFSFGSHKLKSSDDNEEEERECVQELRKEGRGEMVILKQKTGFLGNHGEIASWCWVREKRHRESILEAQYPTGAQERKNNKNIVTLYNDRW